MSSPSPIVGFVTPQQFVAANDGKTDDSTAIQQAWNYAATNRLICRMSGSYYFATTLVIPTNLHVWAPEVKTAALGLPA